MIRLILTPVTIEWLICWLILVASMIGLLAFLMYYAETKRVNHSP